MCCGTPLPTYTVDVLLRVLSLFEERENYRKQSWLMLICEHTFQPERWLDEHSEGPVHGFCQYIGYSGVSKQANVAC